MLGFKSEDYMYVCFDLWGVHYTVLCRRDARPRKQREPVYGCDECINGVGDGSDGICLPKEKASTIRS